LSEEQEIEDKQESEMGFMDHFTELRKRLVWSVIGLVVASGVSAFFYQELVDSFLLVPAKSVGMELQNLKPFGQVFLTFKIVLYSGVTLSLPFILYQVWCFIRPGLYDHERSWAKWIVFYTFICFICGVLFSYYVMIPQMLGFSVDFGTKDIKNVIDINEYWSFIMMLLLSAGIFFELPVVAYILSRAGLITPMFLRKYRRHSIVVILIVAAIVTPTPDPFNQMVVALPIYILFEISILISAIALKQYIKSREI
jgi:sec-independent protein translocase protein TatC